MLLLRQINRDLARHESRTFAASVQFFRVQVDSGLVIFKNEVMHHVIHVYIEYQDVININVSQ